jgi:hypothetical protein
LSAKDKAGPKSQELSQEIARLNSRLDLFDERLDNMDSVVSAVVERVMSQPLALGISCPHCGKNSEISLIGSYKPGINRGK